MEIRTRLSILINHALVGDFSPLNQFKKVSFYKYICTHAGIGGIRKRNKLAQQKNGGIGRMKLRPITSDPPIPHCVNFALWDRTETNYGQS